MLVRWSRTRMASRVQAAILGSAAITLKRIPTTIYGSAHFYVWDGLMTTRDFRRLRFNIRKEFVVDLELDVVSISEQEFVSQMLEAGGSQGSNRFDPLSYLLNDRNTTLPSQSRPQCDCDLDPQTALYVSPDDSHVAVRVDDDTFSRFYYVWPLLDIRLSTVVDAQTTK